MLILVRRLSVAVLACSLIVAAILLHSSRHATTPHAAGQHHGSALADSTLAPFAARAFHPARAPKPVGPGSCSVATGGCVTGCAIPIAGRQVKPPSQASGCEAARSSRPCMLPVASAPTGPTSPAGTAFCKAQGVAPQVERNTPKRLP